MYIKADNHIIHASSDQKSFDQFEDTAQEKGYALGVLSSHPRTVKNLAVWIEKIAHADYVLAPASAIYDTPRHVAARQKNK